PQFFGHGFSLSLAFEVLTGPCAGCVWRDYSAFALLGRDGSTPVWIYASKLDLQEAVVGLSDFLRAMLSPLRAAFSAHVDPAAGPVTTVVAGGGINHAAFSDQRSIPEDWIDSDRAMNALAPFLGGEEVLRAATQLFMQLRVDHFRGQITGPRWGLRIYLDHG